MATNIQTISENQTRKILEWEIPYLIYCLKKNFQIQIIHINIEDALLIEHDSWFRFKDRTAFPIFSNKIFFGLLVFLEELDNHRASQIRIYIDRFFNKEYLSKDKLTRGKSQQDKSSFPVLIKQKNKAESLKIAYQLYLTSPCFAFLNTEYLQWEDGIFHKMADVFIYVPCFDKLSVMQKKIVEQSLTDKSGSEFWIIATQEIKSLPSNIKDLFSKSI